MKKSIYKTKEEMPLFLTVMDVANLLGISRASAYELVRQENFPKLKIVQGRTIIPRDRLLEWLDEQTRYDELWRLKSLSDLCAGISGGVANAFFRAHNWRQRRQLKGFSDFGEWGCEMQKNAQKAFLLEISPKIKDFLGVPAQKTRKKEKNHAYSKR